jgi:hypothetical protein
MQSRRCGTAGCWRWHRTQRRDYDVVYIVWGQPDRGQSRIRSLFGAANHLPSRPGVCGPLLVDRRQVLWRSGIDDCRLAGALDHNHPEVQGKPLVPVTHPIDLWAGHVALAHLQNADRIIHAPAPDRIIPRDSCGQDLPRISSGVPGTTIGHIDPESFPANHQWRLKNCISRSCCSAPCRVLKVPRLRRLPVWGFLFFE